MSYLVCHMEKHNDSALKGIEIHNERKLESSTNPDIDSERTAENYDLINDGPIDYKEKINGIIEEEKTSTRKIRPNAVKACSFVVSSDHDYFENLSPEEEKRFFEESVEFFKQRYGEEKLAFATVHKDERTPHLHVGFVPITEDGRLAAKDFFGNKKSLYSLQDDIAQHMQEKGFEVERGVSRGAKHIEASRYKAEQAQKEAEEASQKLAEAEKALEDRKVRAEEAKNEYEALSSQLGSMQETLSKFPEINDLVSQAQIKTSFWNREIVTMAREDFERFEALAKHGTIVSKELEESQQENIDLRQSLQETARELYSSRDKSMRLVLENEEETDTLRESLEEERLKTAYLEEKIDSLKKMVIHWVEQVRKQLRLPEEFLKDFRDYLEKAEKASEVDAQEKVLEREEERERE